MPETPDSQRPHDDRWERLLQQTAGRRAALASGSMVAAKRNEFLGVLSAPAPRILSPDSPDIDADAARLAARHEEHRISPQFIEMLLRLKQDPQDKATLDELDFLRKKATASGFFLMHYTPEMMRERIQSPSYVITEAYAPYADPQRSNEDPFPAADCQCWIPSMEGNEKIDLPISGSQDAIYARSLIQAIEERPWAFGEVKDIASGQKTNALGYAGAARRSAFHHIENVINPTRGDKRVEYMLASVGQISGLITPNGERIDMHDLGQETGIKNERSVAIHLGGSYPAKHAYTLVDRTVPVEMPDGTYQIVLDWFMFFHRLQAA